MTKCTIKFNKSHESQIKYYGRREEGEKEKGNISEMFPKLGFKECLGRYLPDIMGGKSGRNGEEDIPDTQRYSKEAYKVQN